MSRPGASGRAAVHWLTAQTVAFGVMAALLGIVANAMFLDAYGAAWLPATYVAIAGAGVVVSGAVARSAQRHELIPIALAVLGVAVVAIAAAWLVTLGGGGAWVSIPLLILFPILIQLGFVFIGGQAGRILDIAGIKASFPRIMAGFPAGAVIGGLLGGWLVGFTGRTEDLLLATALAQAGFASLVWMTGRRYASALGGGERPSTSAPGPAPAAASGSGDHDGDRARHSLRRLFASRFVALILAYQVLSALGSQLADYLVYDRAIAQYPDPADLARFLAGYTALMNVASIAFLFLLAGPLLRRYGLRLGIVANPLVLTVFAVAMVAAYAIGGAASLGLLWVVSAARIADIVLTDGTTRTSINATYQVIPERPRVAVQAAVEGIGVPLAIGISGVLIIGLNLLPSALVATIAVTTVTCAVWTGAAILLYRGYGPALVGALRRRRQLEVGADLEASAEDEAAARGLLVNADPRTARLGMELLMSIASPGSLAELRPLADDPNPELRMTALAGMAHAGDMDARRRLAGEVRAAMTSRDPAVRCAALDAVRDGDAFALGSAVAALDDPRCRASAVGAIERLGEVAVPALAERLAASGAPAESSVLRLVRAVAPSPARDEVLRRSIGHRDRDLGLVVMERLVGPHPAVVGTAEALDAVLREDATHAARILAAMAAFQAGDDDRPEADGPLRRALEDELDLVRQRVAAGRLARHGLDRIGAAIVGLTTGGSDQALAVEALEVVLDPAAARLVVPILDPRLPVEEARRRLPAPERPLPTDRSGWLRAIAEDVDDAWRSPWLRACALEAARSRGGLGGIDVGAARALGDPVIDEVLAAAS